MKRFLALLFACLLGMTFVFAQDAPDYQVRLPRYRYASDGQTVIMQFSVYNKAGSAQISVGAELTDFSTRETIASVPNLIPPLQRGEVQEFEIPFDASRYPLGSVQQIEVVVGRDEIEDSAASTFLDNRTVISVTMPSGAQTQPSATSLPEQADTAQESDGVFTIPLLDFQIDLNNSQDRALVIGILLSVLVMVAILLLIFRVLFNGAPTFGNWQAPYVNMPPLDPNSLYGRRQQWQSHAQNNVLPKPCRPGVVTARKLLLGMDDRYLSGWKIRALRVTQYDMYGRVGRSQVLTPKRAVQKLDRLARRADKLTSAQSLRRVKPIAKRLSKQLKKKINRRSAMLPIALDARLQGSHGEVRIVFELYDCQQGRPVRLDQWEPEMTVLGKAIYESYTYTLFGQHGGETYRAFRKRLPQDMARALADLLHFAAWSIPQAEPVKISPAPRSTPQTEPNLRPVTESQKPKTKPKGYSPPPMDSLIDTQQVGQVRENGTPQDANSTQKSGHVADHEDEELD